MESLNPESNLRNFFDSQDLPLEKQNIFPGEVFSHPVNFDTGIRHLLPRYDEMLDVIVRCVPKNCDRILELGCGTGELSLKLLHKYPNAQIVAVDYSPRMLEFAKTKIDAAGYTNRWTEIEMDFGEWANNADLLSPISDGFNACVSSLAIHHLSDSMKLKLFQKINKSLNYGGCFWNADPVLPATTELAEVFKEIQQEWAISQGTTLAEVRAQMGTSNPHGYSSNQDQLASLSAHLEMLTTANFVPVAVPWKYYKLAVFGGFV
ncbi:class I SAM-dependent methyltransferase [Okeania sp. KiyG1]|uniref:class I SAM-dependent methyltransferase n=1 Tax=Okeania sp. KiyG1 TaxID=2720165 RepID=UPI001923712B|nr:class I SAM-dependent methyltransferase [Okeania sp. KiyG1]GGA19811.1 methyltransferase [Okeania sp. KiyG1]